MALPRPAEVLTALRRLGYMDKPAVGDHVSMAKLVADHPEGPITIKTGLDMGLCSKRDVSRIKRQTKLSGKMWSEALAKKLSKEDYDEHLKGLPKAELVPHFWRHLFETPEEPKKQKGK